MVTNDNLVTDLWNFDNQFNRWMIGSRAIVGHPLGVLFGTGSQTNADGSLTLTKMDSHRLLSEIVLGDPNADWRAGLGINLTYKKFNLNVVVGDHKEENSTQNTTDESFWHNPRNSKELH